MIKKINDTQNKTEKILDLKKRHHKDLADKLAWKQEQERLREQRRQEIIHGRAQTKQNLHNSKMGNVKSNLDKSNNVKQDNAYAARIKKENQDKHLARAYENKQKQKTAHDQFRDKWYGGKER